MDVNFAAGRNARHQPSPYPFQNVSQSKPYDRMYKVILCSLDADEVQSTKHVFRNVSIPFDQIKGNCRIFVSSFHFEDNSNTYNYPFDIEIDEIAQPLSYDSRTKSQSKTLLTSRSYSVGNGNPDYGVSVQDLSMFSQRTLTVNVVCHYQSVVTLPNDWILTLGIIQTE
jgi:hypothetical protein